MSSFFAQFHYQVSQLNDEQFDFENKDFDIKQIYQYYQLKVSQRHKVSCRVVHCRPLLQRCLLFTLFSIARKNARVFVPG